MENSHISIMMTSHKVNITSFFLLTHLLPSPSPPPSLCTLVVFHVATMMPTLTSDLQCSNKKLHIGNNFVTIIYNDSGQPYQFGTIKVR